MRELDIGVIGCGTAGPAAALFLARRGHRVTLYEKVRQPGPVGAGIMLQPTGQRVLAELGLLPAILTAGERIDRLRCETVSGRGLVDIAYAHVDPRLFGLGLHRGVLFQALYDAVRAEPRIVLKLGIEGRDLSRREGHRAIIDVHGQAHGEHQLIVVSDGAHSQFRDDTPLPQRVRPYPWGALWFVARDPERRFTGRLHQVVRGTERMLGLLPTGEGPRGEGRVVSLFWSIAGRAVEDFRRGDLEAWKAELRAMNPAVAPVLEQIHTPDDLLYASYKDVEMRRWNTDDVVYIGDSAHAMSPQLGQGANLALMDASALAAALGAEPSVAAALRRYSRERRDHLRFYGFMTRWLTPFFQSDLRPLGPLRDLALPLGRWLPGITGQMVRTMAGLKRGFFLPSMLPDRLLDLHPEAGLRAPRT